MLEAGAPLAVVQDVLGVSATTRGLIGEYDRFPIVETVSFTGDANEALKEEAARYHRSVPGTWVKRNEHNFSIHALKKIAAMLERGDRIVINDHLVAPSSYLGIRDAIRRSLGLFGTTYIHGLKEITDESLTVMANDVAKLLAIRLYQAGSREDAMFYQECLRVFLERAKIKELDVYWHNTTSGTSRVRLATSGLDTYLTYLFNVKGWLSSKEVGAAVTSSPTSAAVVAAAAEVEMRPKVDINGAIESFAKLVIRHSEIKDLATLVIKIREELYKNKDTEIKASDILQCKDMPDKGALDVLFALFNDKPASLKQLVSTLAQEYAVKYPPSAAVKPMPAVRGEGEAARIGSLIPGLLAAPPVAYMTGTSEVASAWSSTAVVHVVRFEGKTIVDRNLSVESLRDAKGEVRLDLANRHPNSKIESCIRFIISAECTFSKDVKLMLFTQLVSRADNPKSIHVSAMYNNAANGKYKDLFELLTTLPDIKLGNEEIIECLRSIAMPTRDGMMPDTFLSTLYGYVLTSPDHHQLTPKIFDGLAPNGRIAKLSSLLERLSAVSKEGLGEEVLKVREEELAKLRARSALAVTRMALPERAAGGCGRSHA